MKELPPTKIPTTAGRSLQSPVSPFRYPGGKSFMAAFLKQRISRLNPKEERVLAEPFCGGAGAALILLADGEVDSLLLNDADVRIYSSWQAMLEETDRFVNKLMTVPLTMAEWHHHREVVADFSGIDYDFDVGFSTFYMNRTSRSGIILKSGPIGGYNQGGKWKLDARFNSERLARLIRWLAEKKARICLSNHDGLSFIDKTRRMPFASNVLFFIDPPYVNAGNRLYFNGMSEAKHVALSDMLTSGLVRHWVLTYDDAPLIRNLYRSERCSKISVKYSLQSKRRESEILVEPQI